MKFARAVPGVVLLLALAATAAPSVAQVIEGPDGPVEFVGLQEWTARELFDAIQELAPDQPFHACAAVMERDLGFAGAAAMSYHTMGSDEVYTVVVGVEKRHTCPPSHDRQRHPHPAGGPGTPEGDR